MPAPAYNDGNIPYGSVILAVGASLVVTTGQGVISGGTNMVAEEVDFEDPVQTIDRRNQIGIPNGSVYIPQKVTGRLTLQLPNATTPVPNVGTTAYFAYRGYQKAFIFTKVGQPLKQLDILKLQLEFAEQLNLAPAFISATTGSIVHGVSSTVTFVTIGAPYPTITCSTLTGTLSAGVFTDLGNGTATLVVNPASTTGSPFTITITAVNSANGITNTVTQTFTLTVT